MAVSRTALIMVLLVLGLINQVTSECWCDCHNTTSDTVQKLPSASRKIKRESNCYPDVKNQRRLNGMKNSDAKIREIIYSLHNNEMMARVIWDPPAECIKKPGRCKGYFVRWTLAFSTVDPTYCQIIDNNSTNYIILDKSAGFDGIKGFDVHVRAFPYRSEEIRAFTFKDPPSTESLNKPLSCKPKATQTKMKTKATSEPLLPKSTSTAHSNTSTKSVNDALTATQQKTRTERNSGSEQTATTLIFSLSVFTVVVISTVALVARRLWKPKEKPIYRRPDGDKVSKGTIYVSYLPEKRTINQVSDIYSWLKSHEIDVVIDQMYHNQKLYNSLGPKRFGEQFLVKADKVIMIITPEYLRLCRLDDTVDIDGKPPFSSLDEERVYDEVTRIKDELSKTLKRDSVRFIPVLVNVSDDYLPKWLQKLISVRWPDDGKNKTFLNLLKGDDIPGDVKFGEIRFV